MKKVLIIVDIQNDFITGSLANKDAQDIIKPMCNFIHDFDGQIICTRDTHFTDYLNTPEGNKLPIEHCIKDTAGWCVQDDILKALRDKNYFYIDKPTFGYTGWSGSTLEEMLFKADIYMCGVCTDICVVSNALILKALYPMSNIKIVKDLCAGLTKEKHEAALSVMESCQCDLVTSLDDFELN